MRTPDWRRAPRRAPGRPHLHPLRRRPLAQPHPRQPRVRTAVWYEGPGHRTMSQMQRGWRLPGRLGKPKSVSFSDVSDGMSGQQRYSDDEFDRALRELADGTAGEPRFREASAAERARQAKQQAKRARKQPRRRRGRRQPERDSRGRATTWTSVGLVLVAAGAFIWLQVRPPSAGTTAAPIAPAVADAGPPADPFTGTPAST